jgi:hypothetical protein
VNAQFNANVWLVVRGTIDSTSNEGRTLSAVGRGPRCVALRRPTHVEENRVAAAIFLTDEHFEELTDARKKLRHWDLAR